MSILPLLKKNLMGYYRDVVAVEMLLLLMMQLMLYKAVIIMLMVTLTLLNVVK
jgi:hypothetical protein